MKTFTSFLFTIALAVASASNLFAQSAGSDTTQMIVIKIENVRSAKGNVLAMARIPGVAEPIYQMAKAEQGAVTLELKTGLELKSGQAEQAEVSIFHDENGNNKLDMGERGPVEGYVTKKCKLKGGKDELKLALYYPVSLQN